MPIDYTDYEALTIPELKDMADQLGIYIAKDTRKSDIIDALRASAPREETKPAESKDSAEQQNIYQYQMSSTETALCSPDDFWKLKLHS